MQQAGGYMGDKPMYPHLVTYVNLVVMEAGICLQQVQN